ncbi:MAG: LapA family protein [Candidatus Krumholzibacteriota bacterium]|nr:LapA family protein [Candidatus Krumholzibacteriota bacterium]
MSGTTRAKMIVAIVLGLIGIIIVLQNFQPVETKILIWRLTMPHVVFLGIVFASGLILGAVITFILYMRQLNK